MVGSSQTDGPIFFMHRPVRSYLLHASRLLCSLVFLVSAITKLYPIEYFENELIKYHLALPGFTEIQARIIIAAELFLGLSLLWPAFSKWAAKWSLLLLLLFDLWLLMLVFLVPHAESCGCFGKWLSMTPAQALLKNAAMQLLLVWIWRKTEVQTMKRAKLVLVVSAIASLSTPFIVSPPIYTEPLVFQSGQLPKAPFIAFGADSLFVNDCLVGNKTVAIFLSSCEHCKMTANRLQAIAESNENIQIRAFIVGDAASSADFMQQAKAQFPYQTVEDLGLVVKSVGNEFPIVLVVKNGEVLKSLPYFSITEQELLH